MSYQFTYDEEAVIQDADIEHYHMAARGTYLMALRSRGVCTHDGVVGASATGEIFYPEQVGLVGDQQRCRDCGVVFDDVDDWVEALEAL
jgi:hypothetical protein